MALKGNLLFNGDFETGTTEGWETSPYGEGCAFDFSASGEAKYRGSYGGLLTAQHLASLGYVAYNKICAFEEYEAYLFILYTKITDDFYSSGVLYGLDDKGNLIDHFYVGYNTEVGEWKKIVALLRGFGDITHFKVGLAGQIYNEGEKIYFDEAKLIPLKSIKGHELSEFRYMTNVTASKSVYSGLSCVGRCRLRSIIKTQNVSGTSPALDVYLNIMLFGDNATYYTLTHSQFTGEDFEEKVIDLPEASYIYINYGVSGTDPSFDIRHHLRIEPY